MIRGIAKTSIALGSHWSGLNAMLKRRRLRQRLPLIVSYHRVVEDFCRSAKNTIAPMLTSTATFEKQLDWIGKEYEFGTLDDVAEWLKAGGGSRKPLAAVTFDDGYADVYHHAWPILRRKGIPSAVFVVSKLVGTEKLQLHDEMFLLLAGLISKSGQPSPGELLHHYRINAGVLKMIAASPYDPFRITRVLLENLCQAELKRLVVALRGRVCCGGTDLQGLLSMDWSMLTEMSRNDVTVASHTRTHAFLTNEANHKVVDEVVRSRQELSANLGYDIKYFAYPDGRFDSRTVDAVHRAGYTNAFTICRHRDVRHPHLTVPRRVLWERAGRDHRNVFSPPMMSSLMHGVFETSRCNEEHV